MNLICSNSGAEKFRNIALTCAEFCIALEFAELGIAIDWAENIALAVSLAEGCIDIPWAEKFVAIAVAEVGIVIPWAEKFVAIAVAEGGIAIEWAENIALAVSLAEVLGGAETCIALPPTDAIGGIDGKGDRPAALKDKEGY